MKMTFNDQSLELTPAGSGYRLTLGDKTLEVELLEAENGQLLLRVDGRLVRAAVSREAAKRWVTVNGQTFVLTQASGARRGGAHGHAHAAGELLAPMPGQIRAVLAAEGDSVTRGQTLVVLEAMKMEMKVAAPFDGVVKAVRAQVGQTVEKEALLAEVEQV